MAETNGDTAVTAAAEATDLQKKIIKQVEYYFGDMNLARDKFMQEQIKTEDGWIPLETMIKFKRLAQMSEDFDVIVESLKKSSTGLMEVSEDKKKIRRSPNKPLPANTMEHRNDMKQRTVYCKGFSVEVSLDDIQERLEKYGRVLHIQMRKDKDKKFKGSVFAVYAEVKDAASFIKAENLDLGGTEKAVKSTKDDYFKRKNTEKKQKDDKVTQKKQDEKEKEVEERERRIEEETKLGALLHTSGYGTDVSREDIKLFFTDHSEVAWVDYNRGEKEAIIRFTEEGTAKEVWEKVSKDGKIEICGHTLEGRVLEGEEEKTHWKSVFAARMEAQSRKKSGRRNNREHGRSGPRGGKRRSGGDRGGHRGGDRDGPRSKKTKFDSDDEGAAGSGDEGAGAGAGAGAGGDAGGDAEQTKDVEMKPNTDDKTQTKTEPKAQEKVEVKEAKTEDKKPEIKKEEPKTEIKADQS